MSEIEILQKVETIFRKVFDSPSIVLRPETTSSDIEEWDSFGNLNLVVAIEKEFSFKFKLSELQSLTDVQKICTFIGTKIANG